MANRTIVTLPGDGIGPEITTVTVDVLSVHEDMAGKSGPLAGPRQVAEFIEQAMRPERSYRLALETVDDAAAPVLVWHDQQSNGTQRHRHDPRTGASLRAYIKALSWLPIESEL